MARFAIGQDVELYTTVPSPAWGSVASGTRAVVRDVAQDATGVAYHVAVVADEQRTGELLWLSDAYLIEA